LLLADTLLVGDDLDLLNRYRVLPGCKRLAVLPARRNWIDRLRRWLPRPLRAAKLIERLEDRISGLVGLGLAHFPCAAASDLTLPVSSVALNRCQRSIIMSASSRMSSAVSSLPSAAQPSRGGQSTAPSKPS